MTTVNSKCVERQLGRIGLDFVRSQLSGGGPFAAKNVEVLGQGRVREFVAPGCSKPPAKDLSQGGRYGPAEAAIIAECYGAFLSEFLLRDHSHVLLLENQLFRMSDPCMHERQDVFEWEDVTYAYFPTRSALINEWTVGDCFARAGHYPQIILATRKTFSEDLPTRGTLSRQHATSLQEQTLHVLVGAYDEESFVMWSRCDSTDQRT